jgi:hypothetical protein
VANPSGGALPEHVAKYLKGHGVDPADLPGNVLATYASLTPAEIRVLEKTGDVLNQSGLDVKTIANIH